MDIRLLTFHILIHSSKTPQLNELEASMEGPL